MAETKLSSDFWLGIFTPIFLVLFIVPVILLNAWVLTWLWQWYIVPVFGFPPLRMVFAYGLSLTISYLLPYNNAKESGLAAAGRLFLMPFFALGLGWIGTWFI